MKILNIILSIYLLLLSAMPCADNNVDNLVHSSNEITAKNDDHSHDKQNDLCSPFCICNCCGAQVLSQSPIIAFNFRTVLQEFSSQISTYKSLLTSNFYGSIWQPPQIA